MQKYLFIIFFFTSPLLADELNFTDAISISAFNKNVFHHLDASGRKSIAISNKTIAVVWEDNRSGTPQSYVSFKNLQQKSFSTSKLLSAPKAESYEPTVLAINNGDFLFAWEQDQQLWISTGNHQGINPPVLLDKHPAAQVSLTMSPSGKLYACWIQRLRPHQQLMVSELTQSGKQLIINPPVIVDNSYAPRRQSYPSITSTLQGIAVGWEDREHGHTRIYTSFSKDGKRFNKKQVLNDFTSPPNAKYGRGTGATRIALASDKKHTVVASWMDKRNFLGGYDIYAAISRDAGKNYGKDEIVQDMLGENTPQWHPAVAINSHGSIYVAWDDPRDDSPDIWLSHRLKTEWSEDQLVEPASGEGQQDNPSITTDVKGQLHMVWIEQKEGSSALRYARQQ